MKGESGWLPVKISLPAEVQTGVAGRILLRVHASKVGSGAYPEITFGENAIFRDDTAAALTQKDADIFCTYAPKAGKWQVYFQNYGTAGTTPARLELGELCTNAYRGDRGAIAYAHAVDTTGNPHGITPARIGATTAADVEEMLNTVTPAKIGAATPSYVDSKIASAGIGVDVVQASGNSTTAVMSQKAVSDALSAITPAKIGAATPSYVDSAIAAALGEAESALAEV